MSYALEPIEYGGQRLPAQSPLRVAVLISGSGTTLRNLLEQIENRALPLTVTCVISSSSQARGLQHAADHDIPAYVCRDQDHATPEAYRDAMFALCREHNASVVVMGGFLRHLLIPEDFQHRVVNIHPSLIPAFCGKGFYGRRVHQAILDYGCKLTGCTVHFVDNEYDHGPIILQRSVAVADDDTPETLAARVFAEECQAYPEALRAIAQGEVEVHGRQVRIHTSAAH